MSAGVIAVPSNASARLVVEQRRELVKSAFYFNCGDADDTDVDEIIDGVKAKLAALTDTGDQ